MKKVEEKYKSPTHYILLGLVPYTEANLKLAFKPSAFFNDLERLDKANLNKQSLKSAYYGAVRRKLIKIDNSGTPRLTQKGRNKVKKYKSKKLKDSRLMVIFDIPEGQRHKRRKLRALLKELYFKQIQKSVWMSEYDQRDYLKAEIIENDLQDYVEVFESRIIKL